MIESAEREGLLNKNTVILEATSGNTGIAPGHGPAKPKVTAAELSCPETMSLEERNLLQALGAELLPHAKRAGRG